MWPNACRYGVALASASSATPVEVPGLADVVALAAGEFHTCALTGSGAVWCWGGNDDGQLGNGTYTGGSTPVAASGLASGAVGIAAGFRHTCALVAVGAGVELRCWGWNQDGQLGDGTDWGRPSPATVSGF